MNDINQVKSIKDILNLSNLKYGDGIVYEINKRKKIKYKMLYKYVNQIGTSLINLGLKNKRIAVIGDNCYQWEISYLSIICGVGVVVPIDKTLPEKELKKVLRKSKVEAIFCDIKHIDILNKLRNRTNLKYIFSFEDTVEDDVNISFNSLIDMGKGLIKKDHRYIEIDINENDIAVLLFTSGTTSKSKVVALSNKNLVSNIINLSKTLEVNNNDKFLSVLPLHHVFECTFGFLYPIAMGSKIVFSTGLRHIVEELKKYNISVLASVPVIYEMILKNILKGISKVGSVSSVIGDNIKYFISGAAPLNYDVENKYRELNINLMQAYGLTETAPIVTISSNNNYRISSVGKALGDLELELVNKDESGIGELIVKGDSVMLGYFEREKIISKGIKKGWFYTGDLAYIDEDGYVFIKGRKKNVIVLNNGKNIYPEEIEEIINKIVGVKQSLIFELKNESKISVKIVYDKGILLERFSLEKYEDIYNKFLNDIKEVNKNLPNYKNIKDIIVTEIPFIVTSTNKIKRKENISLIYSEEYGN